MLSSSLLSSTIHQLTKLKYSTYNITTALDKESRCLYYTCNTYINNAQNDNRLKLVNKRNWKHGKLKHMEMLRRAMEVKEEKCWKLDNGRCIRKNIQLHIDQRNNKLQVL
jgi:polyferredoxin